MLAVDAKGERGDVEWLRGQTLRQRMRDEKGPMRAADVFAIARQFCKGLHSLHTQPTPIAHCDFKPENMFLQTRSGTLVVRLMDFGIARSLDGRRERGPTMGTPKYMAPERVLGDVASPKADIYRHHVARPAGLPAPGLRERCVRRRCAGVSPGASRVGDSVVRAPRRGH
jgi:serine/threonine protein kinase